MKIKWLGHSAFLLTSDQGVRMLIDPYVSGGYDGDLAYGPIREQADIVTVSHEHADHYDPNNIPAGATMIRKTGRHEIKGIAIEGFLTCHDDTGGRQRGLNNVFRFTIDGLRICHLGDLGHQLSPKEIKAIGPVDILLAPVGGHFTIDAAQASEIADELKARVVIPMHYKTPKTKGSGFPIAQVGEFLKGKPRVRRLEASEIEITMSTLPREPEVWVLKHSN